MSDQSLLSRREFNRETVMAILAAATITITGCGDDNNDATGPTTTGSNRVGVVSANHGHTAIVTNVQLNGNQTVTIDMRAQATHNHTLTLTVAELTSIAANTRVVKDSSTDDGHKHTVTFN